MPIRVFLCPWSVEVIDGDRHVVNPISKRWEDLNLDCSVDVHWPPALMSNGEPDKPLMMCLVRAAVGFDFSQFNALALYRFPTHKLSTPYADLPVPQKKDMLDALKALGIPKPTYNGAETWREVLLRTVRHLNPPHRGFRPDYLDAEFK